MKKKTTMQKLGALFSRKSNQTFGQRFQNLYLQNLGGVQTYKDNRRLYVERGYQDNPVVHAITSITAKHGSKAPWVIKNKVSGNEVRIPLLQAVMDKSNTGASWGDFIQDLITQYILTGNGFATFDTGTGINAGKPSSVFILPSEETQIILADNLRGIAAYRVDFLSNDKEITASDVLHIKTPNPDYDENGNWLYGQSPFRAARISIQSYNASVETGLWFLENKGVQKALFNDNEDEELSEEAVDKLKQKLRLQAQGPRNAANIPIIDGKMAVLDLSSKAKDALVLEQRDYAAREICNVLNFPIQLIGLESSTYQNAKEAKKALWENVIIPILCEVRAGLNRWLTPHFGEHLMLDFDLSGIDALQEDTLLRFKAIKESAGMITINEAREAAGFKPFDFMKPPTDMDEFREQVYVGFTQAVISDTEEVTDVNGGESETTTETQSTDK